MDANASLFVSIVSILKKILFKHYLSSLFRVYYYLNRLYKRKFSVHVFRKCSFYFVFSLSISFERMTTSLSRCIFNVAFNSYCHHRSRIFRLRLIAFRQIVDLVETITEFNSDSGRIWGVLVTGIRAVRTTSGACWCGCLCMFVWFNTVKAILIVEKCIKYADIMEMFDVPSNIIIQFSDICTSEYVTRCKKMLHAPEFYVDKGNAGIESCQSSQSTWFEEVDYNNNNNKTTMIVMNLDKIPNSLI